MRVPYSPRVILLDNFTDDFLSVRVENQLDILWLLLLKVLKDLLLWIGFKSKVETLSPFIFSFDKFIFLSRYGYNVLLHIVSLKHSRIIDIIIRGVRIQLQWIKKKVKDWN